MPPMPIFRYARDATPAPAPNAKATEKVSVNSAPNAGLIAGLVTCGAVILFLTIVLVVPMLRRRHQRSAPPPATVEEFLGKDSTFQNSKPDDIAAILDHLSYLPGQKPPTPKRRSLLLGRRLSSQRPASITDSRRFSGQHRPVSGYNSRYSGQTWDSYYEKEEHYDAQHSVPADVRDPPRDEYAGDYYRRESFIPATAPAAVTTSRNGTRPLNIRSRSGYQPQRARTRDVTSPGSEYSEDSDEEYVHAHGSSHTFRPPVPGKENRGSSIGDVIRSRFSQSATANRDSFALADAPPSRRLRQLPPPMSKSSGMASPAPHARSPMPLDALPEVPPEIPNSSIAVGFALPDSPADVVVVTPTGESYLQSAGTTPGQYRNVPLTPRNVALPRTPRTPGSPLKEVYTISPPRTPLRDVLTPRSALPPDGRREAFTRRDVNSRF